MAAISVAVPNKQLFISGNSTHRYVVDFVVVLEGFQVLLVVVAREVNIPHPVGQAWFGRVNAV